MAHFLKGDTDNKIVDEILQKAVKQGSAPKLNYIYLIDHDETQQGEGEPPVLESIDGELYFNSAKVGGGTQLYLHHITSSEYSTDVFNCYFVTKEPSYSNLNAQTTNSDFLGLVYANINKQSKGGTNLTDADMKYFSLFTFVKFPKLDDHTTFVDIKAMLYLLFISFSPTDIYKPTAVGFNANYNGFANTTIAEINLTKLTDTVTAL